MTLLEVNVDTVPQNRFVFLIPVGFFFHGKVPSFSLTTNKAVFFFYGQRIDPYTRLISQMKGSILSIKLPSVVLTTRRFRIEILCSCAVRR